MADQFKDLLSLDQHRPLEDVTTTDTYAPLEIRIPLTVEPTAANQLQNICRIARNRQIEHLGIVLPLFDLSRHVESYAELYIYGVPVLSLDISEKRISILESKEKYSRLAVLISSRKKTKLPEKLTTCASLPQSHFWINCSLTTKHTSPVCLSK